MDYARLITAFAPYVLDLIASRAVPKNKRFIFEQIDNLADDARNYLIKLKNKLKSDSNPYNHEALKLGIVALKGIIAKLQEILEEVEAE